MPMLRGEVPDCGGDGENAGLSAGPSRLTGSESSTTPANADGQVSAPTDARGTLPTRTINQSASAPARVADRG
jgi:hypothetical protein